MQGVGSALLGATSVAIVTAAFPPQERGRALGINVAAVYLGLSAGPPLGGVLTDAFGWQSVFLINVPMGALLFAWGWRLLPRDERSVRARRRADRPSARARRTSPGRRCSAASSSAFWCR